MPDLESEESAIKLADKLNRIDPNKNMTLANLIKHEKKNIKSACNNNKSKISAPPLNDEFDLSDGSYSF